MSKTETLAYVVEQTIRAMVAAAVDDLEDLEAERFMDDLRGGVLELFQ